MSFCHHVQGGVPSAVRPARPHLAAAAADGAGGTVRIPDARLWWPWPGEPYLYTASVTYGEDLYEETFGIRTVAVEGTQFLINGKPFYFKGFGKHEDAAFRGRGLDVCLDVKDINLIHWLNANFFRTSTIRMRRRCISCATGKVSS